MFKRIMIVSAILNLFIFTKLAFGQGMAIAYYSPPFYPVIETVTYEPMPAAASVPMPTDAPQIAIAATPMNSYTGNSFPATAYVYTVPATHYKVSETTTDPVIRDFRDYDKVYVPALKDNTDKITTAGDIKKSQPIRDFRTDYWRDKYYRDEWHNKTLYRNTYRDYHYFN